MGPAVAVVVLSSWFSGVTVTVVVVLPTPVQASPEYSIVTVLVPAVGNGPTVSVAAPSVSVAESITELPTDALTVPVGLTPAAATVTAIDEVWSISTVAGAGVAVSIGSAFATVIVVEPRDPEFPVSPAYTSVSSCSPT